MGLFKKVTWSAFILIALLVFANSAEATKSVFYSVSPYGTGDIKTGTPTLTVSSGVATITTEQTGNIGVGDAVVYNSLTRYIAPNRIAFTSGGTVELLPGDKVQGATSGATGIVRAIDLDSGTWAGGDAAGYIYFESTTGTFNSSEDLNRIRPSTSNNICTTNGSLQGNIGNGNTQFVLKTAIGADAADDATPRTVTSIGHVYASLSAFEAGFIDSSHINNTSLVTADVVAHACCYYDHDDQTADTTLTTINFGTTGASNYLQIYTPIGGSESINSQRHDGKWNTQKYRLEGTNNADVLTINEDFVRVDGLQIKVTLSSGGWTPFYIASVSSSAKIYLSNSVLKANASGGIPYGTYITPAGTYYIWNNIFYNFIYSTSGYGMNLYSGTTYYVHNNTVYGSLYGIFRGAGTAIAKNNISYNNTNNDYDGTFDVTSTYNLSEDTTAPGSAACPTTPENCYYKSKTLTFTNTGSGTEDFHLVAGDTDAINKAIDLSSDVNLAIWRDIDGNDRYGITWDIGADEYVSSSVSDGKTLTGSSSTAGKGTITSAGKQYGSQTLSNSSATTSKGAVVSISSDSRTLTGASVTVAKGTITSLGIMIVARVLTGSSSTAGEGTPSSSGSSSSSRNLTGVQSTCAIGTITSVGQQVNARTLTGSSSTADKGTITSSGIRYASSSITGSSITAGIGTITSVGQQVGGINTTLESTSLTYSSRTNSTLTEPANTANGDFLVAVLYIESGTTVTTPSGWTLMGSKAGENNYYFTYVYYARRTGSEGWTWNHATANTGMFCKRYTGVISSGDPEDVDNSTLNGTGNPITATGITTVTSGAALIMVQGNHYFSSCSSWSSGLTERFDNGEDICFADGIQSVAGASGDKTVTGTNTTRWSTLLFALKPTVNLGSASLTGSLATAGKGTIVSTGSGDTYYASPSGSGTTCSTESPCTADYCVNTKATYGDTCILKSGTYNQALNIGTSGVTVQGELDGSGNRLSIIDPYTTVTPANWVEATGYGSGGAYKITGIGYEPFALYIMDNGIPYKVHRLCQYEADSSYSSDCTSADYWLTRPADATGDVMDQCPESVKDEYGICRDDQYRPNYWNGIEALWTSNSSGEIYMKFRNGDNPANYTIRIEQNTSSTGNASIYLYYKDNVTIKNLEIRATGYGIHAYYSDNAIIDNNKIIVGRESIRNSVGSNVTISNNIITSQTYGHHINSNYGGGAWACSTYGSTTDVSYCNNKTRANEHRYHLVKHYVGGDTSSDHGLEDYAINGISGDSVIYGNKIYNVGNGINSYHGRYSVYDNEVHDTPSTCISPDAIFNGDSYIHDNLIYNCNINIRLQDHNGYNGNSGAHYYIYNNRSWNPDHVGTHLYYHFDSGGTITHPTKTWIYHNSFSGGKYVQAVSAYNVQNWDNDGMTDTNFVNNVFSSPVFDAYYYSGDIFGACGYNWFNAGIGYINACGSSNLKDQPNPMWPYDLSSPPDFILPSGSNAKNAGVDISQTFNIGGTNYSALPGFNPGYFYGSYPDIGTYEYGPAILPILYWKFDEGTDIYAYDSSGNDITGTLTNSPTWTSGVSEGALSFDGSDDYVTATNALLGSALKAFTLSAWIYPTGLGVGDLGRIMSKETTSANELRFQVVGDSVDFLQVGLDNTNGDDFDTSSAYGSLSPNTWYHVVVTYDDNDGVRKPKLYINGVEVTYYQQQAVTGTFQATNNAFKVGGRESADRSFAGKIDEVRVYNMALTASDILDIYNSSTTRSINGASVTGGKGTITSLGTRIGSALLSGSSTTSGKGTITSLGVQVTARTLTGQSSTANKGTLTPSSVQYDSRDLSGSSSSAGKGTITSTGVQIISIALTGSSAASGKGTIIGTGSDIGLRALTGQSSTAGNGNMTSVGVEIDERALTGLSATAVYGVLGSSGGGTSQRSLEGSQATSANGTVISVGVQTISRDLTGLSVTVDNGTVTSVGIEVGLQSVTGSQVTAAKGTLTSEGTEVENTRELTGKQVTLSGGIVVGSGSGILNANTYLIPQSTRRFTWDEPRKYTNDSLETDPPAGYKLYWGIESGVYTEYIYFDRPESCGDYPSTTCYYDLSLPWGRYFAGYYYFAITAVYSGNESEYSNEVYAPFGGMWAKKGDVHDLGQAFIVGAQALVMRGIVVGPSQGEGIIEGSQATVDAGTLDPSGGGNASRSLTGSQGTSGMGNIVSVGVQISSEILEGAQVISGKGDIGSSGVQIASEILTGTSSTAGEGTITSYGVGANERVLTGSQIVGGIGTVTSMGVEIATEVLVGSQATVAKGIIVSSGSGTTSRDLTGSQATAGSGTIVSMGIMIASETLTGSSVSAAKGTITENGVEYSWRQPTNKHATCAGGTLAAVGVQYATVSLTGSLCTAGKGTVVSNGSVSRIVTGKQITAGHGTLTELGVQYGSVVLTGSGAIARRGVINLGGLNAIFFDF